MNKDITLVGVYQVQESENTNLLEFIIETNHDNIAIEEFTQKQENIDELDWQSPWDEKYLNAEGTKITGDWMDSPTDISNASRLCFFFHFLDFTKPFSTPFGDVDLSQVEEIPKRLSNIIQYEAP